MLCLSENVFVVGARGRFNLDGPYVGVATESPEVGLVYTVDSCQLTDLQ